MADPAPGPEPDPPLSLPGVAQRALLLAGLMAAATLGAGKLLGWSFLRAYQRADTLLFLAGTFLFCMGVFRGKPAPPPRPRTEAAEDADTQEDPEALTPSEERALQRAKERAPALATAGLVLILSTQLLYWARSLLGGLYGR